MGKQTVQSPTGGGGGLFGSPKGANKALQALSVMFGIPLDEAKKGGGIQSIFEAEDYFNQLEDSFFKRQLDQLGQSAQFQREQTGLNQEQALQFSRDAIRSIRDDPVFNELGFFDTEADTDAFAKAINAQRSARGIEGSPVDAAQAGLQLGLVGEQIRNNRIGIARSLFQGAIPGAPGASGTTTAPLFAQQPLTQPLGFASAFGVSGQFGQGNQGIKWDIGTSNAQFGQQWLSDLGSLIGSAAQSVSSSFSDVSSP